MLTLHNRLPFRVSGLTFINDAYLFICVINDFPSQRCSRVFSFSLTVINKNTRWAYVGDKRVGGVIKLGLSFTVLFVSGGRRCRRQVAWTKFQPRYNRCGQRFRSTRNYILRRKPFLDVAKMVCRFKPPTQHNSKLKTWDQQPRAALAWKSKSGDSSGFFYFILTFGIPAPAAPPPSDAITCDLSMEARHPQQEITRWVAILARSPLTMSVV